MGPLIGVTFDFVEGFAIAFLRHWYYPVLVILILGFIWLVLKTR